MRKHFNTIQFFTLSSVVLAISFLGQAVVALADGPAVPAGAPAAAGPQAQPGLGSMLIPFAAMFAVVYFLMIRPQQKKMKQQQEMLNALQHGDEVITTSGMLGKVTGITDRVVTLEVADGVRVKFLKSQVTQIVKGQIKDLAQ
jgi:preprotein translocase subunit YajC